MNIIVSCFKADLVISLDCRSIFLSFNTLQKAVVGFSEISLDAGLYLPPTGVSE